MTNQDNDLRFLLNFYNKIDDLTLWVHKVGFLISVDLNHAIVITFASHFVLNQVRFWMLVSN